MLPQVKGRQEVQRQGEEVKRLVQEVQNQKQRVEAAERIGEERLVRVRIDFHASPFPIISKKLWACSIAFSWRCGRRMLESRSCAKVMEWKASSDTTGEIALHTALDPD